MADGTTDTHVTADTSVSNATSPTAALAELLQHAPVLKKPKELTLSDLARETPYRPEAFAFLQRGLARAAEKHAGENRHVRGQDLCLTLREQAHAEWGSLATLVLHRHGVRRTEDFGAMVYHLANRGVLSVSDDDRIEDFDAVYDFHTLDDYVIPANL
jgi:uncharacterized repeat protein (TIGR04138 family)